uniref:Uncharacterized protein n=1 Tax=viral metagenome TaxID=1070528 RepID=A0A6M3K2X5_9ZZZZ
MNIGEVGCNQNGDVWMSLYINVNGESQKAVMPMTPVDAKWLIAALEEALKQGEQWRTTGVHPNERDGTNIDRCGPAENRGDSHGGNPDGGGAERRLPGPENDAKELVGKVHQPVLRGPGHSDL